MSRFVFQNAEQRVVVDLSEDMLCIGTFRLGSCHTSRKTGKTYRRWVSDEDVAISRDLADRLMSALAENAPCVRCGGVGMVPMTRGRARTCPECVGRGR